jgi:hypothetical protein
MAKYKIGDVVLVKFTITEVEPDDELPTYHMDTGDWFNDADVFAVVTQGDEPEPEPVKPEPLKVGEFVKSNSISGQVVRVSESIAIVLLANGNTTPVWMEFLTRAERPADWPF